MNVKEALLMFREGNMRTIIIKGSGQALRNAIKVVEEVKRYESGLHQINKFSKRTVKDVWTPNEADLDDIVKERTIDGVEVILSKDAQDSKDPGYQAPLPASEIRKITIEEIQQL